MKRMMNDAEGRLRGKLTSLPDGTWNATGYQDQSHEGDRGLHKITLAMTKRERPPDLRLHRHRPAGRRDQLHLRRDARRGHARPAADPGRRHPVVGRRPDALLRPHRRGGHDQQRDLPRRGQPRPIGPAWLTGTLVAECLSQMLDRSVDLGKSVQAVCCGTWDTAVIAGLDERGASPVPFLNIMMEPMAGGYGARPHVDGMDTGGLFCIPMGRIPDTEMSRVPLPDAGAVAAGGSRLRRPRPAARRCQRLARRDALRHQRCPSAWCWPRPGKAVAQNNGLAGGYPGNTGLEILARGTDVRPHCSPPAGCPRAWPTWPATSRTRPELLADLPRSRRGAVHALAGRRRLRRPAAAATRTRSRPTCARARSPPRPPRTSTAWSTAPAVDSATTTRPGPRPAARQPAGPGDARRAHSRWAPRPLDRTPAGREPGPGHRRRPSHRRLRALRTTAR